MDTAEPLTLPRAPEPASRPPVPKLAALVPLAGGIVMWMVTGSMLALCFAALGPVMMIASVVDGARQRRREEKKAEKDAARQWERAEDALEVRLASLREQRSRQTPDTRGCLSQTPISESDFGPDTRIVIGRGDVASGIRVSGGEGQQRGEEFRARAAWIPEAPLAVKIGEGICLRGPLPIASAVARALVVQMCRRFRAGQLALVGEGVEALGLAEMPHSRSRSPQRLSLCVGSSVRAEGDVLLCVVPPDHDVPEGVSMVIDCEGLRSARVRSGDGEHVFAPEALSRMQVETLAASWPESDDGGCEIPETLGFGDLPDPSDLVPLGAIFASGERGDLLMDLAADGPHAIVTGMTGAGKSELLISWVLGLAAAHSPEEVNFVLADFKGGTAFDPLRVLPHVAAVITDLDASGAERGVQSLRAELRRREEVLAAAQARDIGDAAVTLARLVIVVDEFAALLHEHPELGEVFTDIAARGRALGMHLILGTQRAAGVVREALAANCPLRLSLRVTDAADSRLVVGVPDAAELPGDPQSRGLAIARRPRDSDSQLVRIALTTPKDIVRVQRRWAHASPARSPWLPSLPTQLTRDDVQAPAGEVLLGLADEPLRQRQKAVTLLPGHERGIAVFGAPASGKSTVLASLATQVSGALRISADLEQAWDRVTALAEGDDPLPPLVLIDDLDALLSAYPSEYSQALVEKLEMALRRAGAEGATVVMTATRSVAAVLRLADLLPRRALLALPSRADHVAAGGTSESYLPRRPAGRAHLDGVEVQLIVEPLPQPAQGELSLPWVPAMLTAIVSTQPGRLVQKLRERHPQASVVRADEWDSHESERDEVTMLVDDADGWQRQWGLWQRMRASAEVLVAAECPAELRTLMNSRELPPYARTHRGRAWLFRDGVCAGRVVV